MEKKMTKKMEKRIEVMMRRYYCGREEAIKHIEDEEKWREICKNRKDWWLQ